MFSRLDAIFKSNFLPLKEGDTYPGKKREDDAGGERYIPLPRKQPDPNSDLSDFDEDHMVVSVATLLTFLNELTTAPDIKHDFSDRNRSKAAGEAARNAQKIDNKTERAINAYRHTAEAGNPPKTPKKEGRIDRMMFHFDAEEKEILADLVNDLETLQRQGLRDIEIGNANSFFAGIVDAVTAAKDNLK